jgi:hypothetical protein
MEEVLKLIQDIDNRVVDLEQAKIQLNMDPTTALYLKKVLGTLLTTYPTQTYSASGPSGIAPIGSVWFQDTGVLATNAIYVSNGTAWVQIK